MNVTVKSSASKLARELPALKPSLPYFMHGGAGALLRLASFEQLNRSCPTWCAESMAYGARRLCDIAESGAEYIYSVYSEEEIKKESAKKHVKLLHFPGERGKPFVVVCAGGGYSCVCSVVEGFPVAARLNALGYSAFVLNYRTGEKKLFPKPMDDLAAALSFIFKNEEKFQIDPSRYAVTGFSAGGNLCCEWGSDNHGYAHYNIQKPTALFPVYPFVSTNLDEAEHSKFFETMFGKGYGDAEKDEYDVLLHLGEYPPCYIVACRDDDTVAPRHSEALKEAIDERGISAVLEMGEKGGHGFGDGGGTDVAGWVARAAKFFEEQ